MAAPNRPLARRQGALLPCLLGLFAVAGFAQAPERQKILPPTGIGTSTGYSLSMDGDVLVMGAPNESSQASGAGAAHVYRLDPVTGEWAFESTIYGTDPQAGSGFGDVVAVSGDVLAVSAPWRDTSSGADAGAVFVFRHEAATGLWKQEQELHGSATGAGDHFGVALSIEGDVLVVGAPQCDSLYSDAGIAYVFRDFGSATGWAEEAKLVDPDGLPADRAGKSVATNGNAIAVGSPAADENGAHDSGSVALWLHIAGTWVFQQELTAAVPEVGANFGNAVALQGKRLAVGAPFEKLGGVSVGAVHVFETKFSVWSEVFHSYPTAPLAGDQFGSAIAFGPDVLVVGAWSHDKQSGLAETFRFARGGWWQDLVLRGSDTGAMADYFGFAVTASADHLAVGAPQDQQCAVYCYPTAELGLEFTPAKPAPGETVTLECFYGRAKTPVLLVVVEVDGSPTFLPLLRTTFDSTDRVVLSFDAPDPLFGTQLGVVAIEIQACGALGISPVAKIDL